MEDLFYQDQIIRIELIVMSKRTHYSRTESFDSFEDSFKVPKG